MGYAEAIEQQMAMYSYYASGAGRGMVHRMMAQPFAITVGPDADADGVLGRVLLMLAAAAPFYVAQQICATVAYGASSFPLPYALPASRVPVLNGFVWFEQPLALPETQDGPAKPLRALAWAPSSLVDTLPPGTSRIAQIDTPTHLLLQSFHDVSWCPVPVVAHTMTLPLGEASGGDEPLGRKGQPIRREATLRYLFTLLEFMADRVLAVSSRPILNRQARRRLARSLGHEPVVRVVELRQREYQQRDESQATHTEYTCQWLVRGHWHQYHTREGVQPRWVSPYVKGPSDKPLKAPTITAYEVVR